MYPNMTRMMTKSYHYSCDVFTASALSITYQLTAAAQLIVAKWRRQRHGRHEFAAMNLRSRRKYHPRRGNREIELAESPRRRRKGQIFSSRQSRDRFSSP